MPNEVSEVEEVLSEVVSDTSESVEQSVPGSGSLVDGNPEDSPYFVGIPETSEGISLYSETLATDVSVDDIEAIHAYLESQHSQQVLIVVLLAAILGCMMVKFFF